MHVDRMLAGEEVRLTAFTESKPVNGITMIDHETTMANLRVACEIAGARCGVKPQGYGYGSLHGMIDAHLAKKIDASAVNLGRWPAAATSPTPATTAAETTATPSSSRWPALSPTPKPEPKPAGMSDERLAALCDHVFHRGFSDALGTRDKLVRSLFFAVLPAPPGLEAEYAAIQAKYGAPKEPFGLQRTLRAGQLERLKEFLARNK